MKSIIISILVLASFEAFSQTPEPTQPIPQVVEKDGKLLYVVPAQAAQEVVLTVELLEGQQKAIKERKELLEKQSKAIQDEYAALNKQESDVKDWLITALKLKNNTPTASKQEEAKKQ